MLQLFIQLKSYIHDLCIFRDERGEKGGREGEKDDTRLYNENNTMLVRERVTFIIFMNCTARLNMHEA